MMPMPHLLFPPFFRFPARDAPRAMKLRPRHWLPGIPASARSGPRTGWKQKVLKHLHLHLHLQLCLLPCVLASFFSCIFTHHPTSTLFHQETTITRLRVVLAFAFDILL